MNLNPDTTIYAAVRKDLYRYEIHALLKAFFPSREVKVLLLDENGACAGIRKDRMPLFYLTVDYADDAVAVTLRQRGGSLRTVRQERKDGDPPCDMKAPSTKDALKDLLYHLLCEETGRTLPWGELIGIRPTKLAVRELAAGGTVPEATRYLEERHFVSTEKALLAAQIAQRERALLKRLYKPGAFSLYVGIPFCPTTCFYCTFPSNALHIWQDRVEEYLGALFREIDAAADYMRGGIPDTVYIGGGTPTTLTASQLDKLLTKIERTFPSAYGEYTVEAGRPDTITSEKLDCIRAHGVTRISINPQTMKEATLRSMGRGHTPAQIIDAFCLARERGFDNINMDMILGLPGESAEDVGRTVAQIERLGPESLTVHALAVKKGSKLLEMLQKEQAAQETGTDISTALMRGDFAAAMAEEMTKKAAEGARRMGMLPYYLYRQKNITGNFENIGYAVPGKEGLYNMLIIEEVQDIVALGAGAISKHLYGGGKLCRCENARDVAYYIANIEEMIDRKRALFAL